MATFIVTNTNDSGEGSLRDAVAQANATAGADTVTFADAVQGGTIRLTSGEIVIAESLVIDGGPGGVLITGDANGDDVTYAGGVTDVAASLDGDDRLDDNSRVFNALDAELVTLQRLTITGGRTTADLASGGAVLGGAVLQIVDGTLAGNSTTGDYARGGGAFATVLRLTNATLVGNATSGDAAGGGGAWANSLYAVNSTVTGNSTSGVGIAGVAPYAIDPIAYTFSAGGGGLFGRNTFLTNSLVVGNTTTGAGVGNENIGYYRSADVAEVGEYRAGSVLLTGGGSTPAMITSIVGFRDGGLLVSTSPVGDNGLAYLFGSDPRPRSFTETSTIFAETTTLADGVIAGVLADNGGPVRTVALAATNANPALDRSDAESVAADARGVAASDVPAVGREGTGTRDLGAFEAVTSETVSLVVTTAADVVDAFDGLTSLREAVATANRLSGDDTITFDPAVFDGSPGAIIRLTQGALFLSPTGASDTLTIDGGPAGVTITGDRLGDDVTDEAGRTDVMASREGVNRLADNSRIIVQARPDPMNPAVFSGELTLKNLTLTGGYSTTGVSHVGLGRGGGAAAATTLTLIDSVVTGNATGGSYGGGGVAGFTVTLLRSTVTNNHTLAASSSGGGGVFATFVNMSDSSVSDNSTRGGIASGGGVLANVLNIENSTITGNQALGGNARGGGFASFGSIGTTVVNSTITGNTSAGLGGGIFGSLPITLTNSIVLGNETTGAGVGGENISVPTLLLTGGNIIGDDSGRGDVFDGATDVGDTTAAAVFAQTRALAGGTVAGVAADNGGPVETVALRPDAANPALDAAREGPAADARGVAAVDLPGVGPAGAGPRDLGAFEVQALLAAETPSLVVTTAADVVDAFDGLTSLREAVAFANATAGADTVTFTEAVQGGTIRLTSGEIVISESLVIDGGPGGVLITGDANGDDVTYAGGVTDVAASLDGEDRLDDNTRVFNAFNADLVTLQRLTITGGRTTADFASGGAVLGGAELRIVDGTLAGNSTTGDYARGGGAFATVLRLTNATLVGNTTSGDAAGGGGAWGRTVYAVNSTVTGNSTSGVGIPGVTPYASNPAPYTFSADGGGLSGFDVFLTNSIVAGNATFGAGVNNEELGFYRSADVGRSKGDSYAGEASLKAAPQYMDESGSIVGFRDGAVLRTLGGFVDEISLEGYYASGPRQNPPQPLTIVSLDGIFTETTTLSDGTRAGVLADNGGPVRTVALAADSANPALDRSDADRTTADARGVAAFDVTAVGREGTGTRDLGAFELVSPEAASLVVTTTADVVDGFDGVTSLREAVIRANGLAGDDTITFDPTVFDGSPGAIIRLTQGALLLNPTVELDALTIDGGPAGVTITGDRLGDDVTDEAGLTDVMASREGVNRLTDNSRILQQPVPASGEVRLKNLTLTGGYSTDRVTIAGNSDGGGAIAVDAVALIDSVVKGNATGMGFGGGGIAANHVSLLRTTVADNHTLGYGAGGGGVNALLVSVTDSIVSDNSTRGGRASGGGIFSTGFQVENSTISGNEALGFGSRGGGLFGTSNDMSRLVNSTVTGNSSAGPGGGVSFGGSLALTITNSIVLGNETTGAGVGGENISVPTLRLTGANIIGDDAGGGDVFDGATDVGDTTAAAVFAQTRVLAGGTVAGVAADNGGPVATVALRPDAANPALDAAREGPAADARGVAAVDLPGVGPSGAGPRDLGAFEAERVPETPSLVVTTAADVVDAFDGQTSLREAVAFANATAGADTVTFDAAVTFIRLTQGQIAITDAAGLTIDGGAGVTITGDALGDDVTLEGGITDVAASLSGGDRLDDNTRIFEATAGALTLDGLTLTGGRTTTNFARGGAVLAAGDLTLIGTTVSGNSTADDLASGGGVYGRAVTLVDSVVSANSSGGRGGGVAALESVTVTNSTVSGNSADGSGGGVAGYSAVRLTNSTVSGNSTAGDFSRGGGVYSRGGVTLTNSTVSDNSTAGDSAAGGGVAGQIVRVTNSTVSANSTSGDFSTGGGVYGYRAVTLTNSTVSGNSTAGDGAEGGGVFAADNATMTNSVVLGNATTLAGVRDVEVGLSLFLIGGNILGDGAGGANVFSAGADVGDTTAAAVFAATVTLADGTVAGALADNGGPVRTIALKADAANPALDASTGYGVTTDARGVAAADIPGVGASGTGAAVRDLGAFEVEPETPSLVVTTAADVVDALDNLTSLREAVAFANATAGADTVTFAPGVQGGTIRLTLGQITITDAAGLTIDGGAGVTITGDRLGDDVTLEGGITDVAASLSGGDRLDDNTRIFEATAGALTLDGLTLTGGRTTANFARGGAVLAAGDLTLIGTTVSGNSTADDRALGGGVYGRAVTLVDSVVSANSTAGEDAGGGGVAGGTVMVTNSTVSGNSTAGIGAFGGGILGAVGVVLVNSTVSGNSTAGDSSSGGGVASYTATVTNSTVSGNSTAGIRAFGGGVFTSDTVTLVNSTVSGNSTSGDGVEGGGVFAVGDAMLTNSVVLGNAATGASVSADSIEIGLYAGGIIGPAGTSTLTGGNIVGDGAGGADVFDGETDVGDTTAAAVFADTVTIAGGVVAGRLADNGGPGTTVALRLANDNPALGAAAGADIPATDARGVARDAAPDLGAYEAPNPAPVAADDDATTDAGVPVTVDVLENDSDVNGGLDPTSVRIAGAPGDGRTLDIAGEGVWTVNPLTGVITFAPAAGFAGPAATIDYTVADRLGARSDAAALTVDVDGAQQTVTVRLGGVGGPTVAPAFVVLADGVEIGNGTVTPFQTLAERRANGVAYEDRSFTFAGDTPPSRVAVRFINDGTEPGGDNRDLFVDRVTFGGRTYESEVDGYFTRDNGSAVGVGPREALNWNGTLVFEAAPPPALTLRVVAAGVGGPAVAPRFTLSVNGETVATQDVAPQSRADLRANGRDYEAFDFMLDADRVDDVAIAFVNDGTEPGGDNRDLFIDRIELIDGAGARTVLQSEVDGFFTRANGNPFGSGPTEALYWNGVLRFDGIDFVA